MMKNLDLNDLYLFVQVVDAGNFNTASKQLCIPKSTISRRIDRLEKQLGVVLIKRNTHQFETTELGEQYYQHCQMLVEQVKNAQHFIDNYTTSQGKVTLTCPKELLDLYVNDILLEFMRHYPEIQLVVESSNRAVDLVKERVDFAIRVRPWPLEDSNIIARPFCLSQHHVVASPELIAEPLTEPEALLKYPCLTWFKKYHFWHLTNEHLAEKTIPYQPKLVCDNLYLVKQAVLKGMGIAALPDALIRKEIKQGKLRLVLQKWQMKKWMVHAAYHSRSSLTPSARLLLDFLALRLGQSEIML